MILNFLRKRTFFKLLFIAGVFLFLASFVFSFSQNQNSSYPDPRNYAPNFWFDSEEEYYPVNPFCAYPVSIRSEK